MILEKLKQIIKEAEKGLEIPNRNGIIEIYESQDAFDKFDWSDIELPPEMLPSWVRSDLDSNIPQFVNDGDIIPRYVGDFVFDIKYIDKSSFDYIVVYIKRIKGIKSNDN